MCVESISVRVEGGGHVHGSGLPLNIIWPSSRSEMPPWKRLKPKVDTTLVVDIGI